MDGDDAERSIFRNMRALEMLAEALRPWVDWQSSIIVGRNEG